MKKISSSTNPLIKEIAKLHQAKKRKQKQQYIAEGIRTITTLLDAGYKPIYIFVVEKLIAETQKLIAQEKIIIVNKPIMSKISATKTPSGILAVFPIPSQPSQEKIGPGIVLAHITDPGNAGTLIRTAAAMNKKTVVFVEGVDPWNPKVVQATAGALGLVNIFIMSWQELMEHKTSHHLCALVVSGGKKPNEINLKNKLIVVGSEAQGIPQEWINQCEEKLTLPMPGKFESLNAAVAGSIALYLAAN